MATSVRFAAVCSGALLCLAWGMVTIASAQAPAKAKTTQTQYSPYGPYPAPSAEALRILRIRIELGMPRDPWRPEPMPYAQPYPSPLPYPGYPGPTPRYDFRLDQEYDFRRGPSPYPIGGDPYRDPRCPICPPYGGQPYPSPYGGSPYAQPYAAPGVSPISRGGPPQGYQQYSTRPGSRFTPAIVPVPGAPPPRVTESRSRP